MYHHHDLNQLSVLHPVFLLFNFLALRKQNQNFCRPTLWELTLSCSSEHRLCCHRLAFWTLTPSDPGMLWLLSLHPLAHLSLAGIPSAKLPLTSPRRSYYYVYGFSSCTASIWWLVGFLSFLSSERVPCRAFGENATSASATSNFFFCCWSIGVHMFLLAATIYMYRSLFGG